MFAVDNHCVLFAKTLHVGECMCYIQSQIANSQCYDCDSPQNVLNLKLSPHNTIDYSATKVVVSTVHGIIYSIKC